MCLYVQGDDAGILRLGGSGGVGVGVRVDSRRLGDVRRRGTIICGDCTFLFFCFCFLVAGSIIVGDETSEKDPTSSSATEISFLDRFFFRVVVFGGVEGFWLLLLLLLPAAAASATLLLRLVDRDFATDFMVSSENQYR